MSKVDAQRAMREAKYLARQKAGANGPGAAAPPPARAARPAPTTAAKPARPEAASAAPTEGGLCGHKSMNGRSCTRPSGHAEKNHRYG